MSPDETSVGLYGAALIPQVGDTTAVSRHS
jgi:hypothetical protein